MEETGQRRLKFVDFTKKDVKRLKKFTEFVEDSIDMYLQDMNDYFKRLPEFLKEIPKEHHNRVLNEIPKDIILTISKGNFDSESLAQIRKYASFITEIGVSLDWYYGIISYTFKMLVDIYVTIGGAELHEIPELTHSINKALIIVLSLFTDNFMEKVEAQKALESLLKELSTPILHTWDGVIVMPLIGTLTSDRAQEAMEVLLNSITQYRAKVAIIDITGVSVIDSMVAEHLIKTVKAVKILGSEAIITGISAEVASILVRIGIEVEEFITRSSLREGLQYAIKIVEGK